MSARPQFRILGPLEIRVAGKPIHITAPREQATLATLLLYPGRVVSVDQLARVVWEDRPPAVPSNQVAICISALRRKLAAAGAPGDLITTMSPGYLLREQACDLDSGQVVLHANEARRLTAAGRLDDAAGQLRSALQLWRGPVLAGICRQPLQPEIVRWQERRLAIAEQLSQLELDMGHAQEIVGDLFAAVAEQPLRERPRAQLMVALHRVGRTAEALDVYSDLRNVLRTELGLEPNPELRALQEAILRGLVATPRPHPAADGSAIAGPVRPPMAPAEPRLRRCTPGSAPATLPADIADFTGRTGQIGALTAALTGVRGTAVPVVLVSGLGGVGKTALAVHLAHRLASEFPDGQLYIDLQGKHSDSADPADVVGSLLHALGVRRHLIPDGLQPRAAMYRGLLSRRRVLVVLDDAAAEAQLEPLLPGTATCAVVVTSRLRLTGLAGARHAELDAFGLGESLALLRVVAGSERVDREPQAAVRLVGYCANLPLAVRIIGARLAAKPHWTLTRLAGQLASAPGRLDELAHGTLSVRASLALSYRRLPLQARRLLRRLGQLDAGEYTACHGAALLGTGPERAAEAFESLVDARLVEVALAGPGAQVRYRLHDLARVFARERAEQSDSADGESSTLGGWRSRTEIDQLDQRPARPPLRNIGVHRVRGRCR